MSILQKGMQWKRHTNKRQAIRNLRNACRSILNSRKPEDVRAKARVMDAVKGEPEPEFGFLHLIYAAIDASDQTGESFATAMTYLMDQFDNMKEDSRVKASADPAA